MKPGVLRVVLPTIAATLVCLTNLIAQAPTLKYDVEYMCNRERVVVRYCRNDSGQPVHESQNYCHVEYLDRPRRIAEIAVFASMLKSEAAVRLQSCIDPNAANGTGSSGATTSTSNAAVNQALSRGLVLMKAKDYNGAMVEFKEVLRLDPRHAIAFYQVGVAQYNLKDYTVANAAFERALQLNVANPHVVYVWIGDYQLSLGQHMKALSAYQEAVKVKPNYADGFNKMGLAYFDQKDFANAVIFFGQAARVDPKLGIYRKNAGMAYLGAGKKDEAMKVYNALVVVDPKLANELLDQITKPATAAVKPRTPAETSLDNGWKFYDAKDYQKALASYQEALRLKPDYGMASHYLGMTHFQLKQYPQARVAFENALKFKYAFPSHSHLWIGDTYNAQKEYAKAISAYQEAVRLKPDYDLAFVRLGNSNYSLKQYTEALTAYQAAIKLKPDDAICHANMGDTYSALKQYDKAILSYGEAVRIDPKHDVALNNVGTSHYLLKQYAPALAAYEQALKLKPDNALYLMNLGDTYFALERKADALAVHKKLATLDKAKADELLGRINKSPADEQANAAADAALNKGHEAFEAKEYAKAIVEYQKAVAAKPANDWLAVAHSMIGVSYTRLRDYSQATTNLLTAARLDPKDPTTFGELGYVYETTLQFPKAVTAYQEAMRLNAKDPAKAARIHERLGTVYALMDRKADAMAVYTSLQKSDPDKAKSLLPTIQRGDEEGPAGILVNYGDGAEFMGANEDALEYYRNSAKLPAVKLSARFGAASGLNLLGKPAEAMAILQNVLKLRPSKDDLATVHHLIGQTYNQMREYAKAIPEIRKAQQIKVDSDYSYELGNSFFYLKQYPDALVAFQEAVRLKPDDFSSILRLAETLAAMGQHDKASAYLSELTRDHVVPSFTSAQIGELYFSMKRYPDAVAVYKKALASYPKYASLNYGLGVVYVAMGQKQDAMAVYRVLRPLDNDLAQKLLAEINKP